ncbi:MAG: hypothetical protein Q9227_008169 [Pyrenula ochraceoflavens]
MVGHITVQSEGFREVLDVHGEDVENHVAKTSSSPEYEATKSPENIMLQFQVEKDKNIMKLDATIHKATLLQHKLLSKHVHLDNEYLDVMARQSPAKRKSIPLLHSNILLETSEDTRDLIDMRLMGYLRESSDQIQARRGFLPERNRSRDDVPWSHTVRSAWPLDQTAKGSLLTPICQAIIAPSVGKLEAISELAHLQGSRRVQACDLQLVESLDKYRR